MEPKDCPHEQFFAKVDVFRLKADTDEHIVGYSADIKINCSQCGQAFQFIGVPMGISPAQPMTDFDCEELRAPIRPSTAPISETDKTKVN